MSETGGLTVVGLGASAGGLEALEQFFDALPRNPGAAFVIVSHQRSGRTSLLPSILARYTVMPVSQLDEPREIEVDHVYVAAPGTILEIDENTVVPRSPTRGGNPIDHFFTSLAQRVGRRAIGIVLSGTGNDGARGLHAIKDAGGKTMVQEQASARFPEMPRSAMAESLIDCVLPADELAMELVDPQGRSRPQPNGTTAPSGCPPPGDDRAVSGRSVEPFVAFLRKRGCPDFSGYKPSTLRRRIDRRMGAVGIDADGDYLEVLGRDEDEASELFKELLIGVTSFFRDPQVFVTLRNDVIPRLLAGKAEGETIRVWVPGCSTGEEAYSLAILLREGIGESGSHRSLQIFATDIDEVAIADARAGVFSDTIRDEVGEARLNRFFVPENGKYRVKRELRELIVFAPHDLIEDPPFTRIDLVSCRNVLIYFDAELQRRVLPVFHYALAPGGYLVLGTSESVGSADDLFEVVDQHAKIYRRLEAQEHRYLTSFPQVRRRAAVVAGHEIHREPGEQVGPEDIAAARRAERYVLELLIPPSVVIREDGGLVHVYGRTGRYLEPAPGPQDPADVFIMARQGLQLALPEAVRRAAGEGEVIEEGVRVSGNGADVVIDLRVKRLEETRLEGMYLVSFLRPRLPQSGDTTSEEDDDSDRETIEALERELRRSRESHQAAVEDLHATNEELRSVNEELQLTNEELQSTNEELETSKEEMQSLNEELQSVNIELRDKVGELTRANNDVHNLLNGTNIATLFLDEDLHIKRYTDRVPEILHLIPSDIGRPIADLTSKLDYDLVTDARQVVAELEPVERVVHNADGADYLVRIAPYCTEDNAVEGIVLTFVDITSLPKEAADGAQ